MKKSVKFMSYSIALTLGFYLLVYYFMPGPPPTASMMILLAAVAISIVAAVTAIVQQRKKTNREQANKKSKSKTLVALFVIVPIGAALCVSWELTHDTKSPSAPDIPPSSAGLSPPPPQASPPPAQAPISAPNRVTGYSFLMSRSNEASGYGLYSYILLPHHPTGDELPRYRAFLEAIVGLPSAEALSNYVPKSHVNVTYIPVTSPINVEQQNAVDNILARYDYARASAILSILQEEGTSGPLIVSVLNPVDFHSAPHPVLIQDLSRAQPALASAYVQQFVSQVSQDRFWQASSLSEFSIALRNLLETAATGLGLSKEAVASWIEVKK